MALREYIPVRATVRYLYDDLRPDALPDGWRGLFMPTYHIEEDEQGGRFTGDLVMVPAALAPWVPERELIDIEEVSWDKYNAALKALNEPAHE